MNNMPNSTPKIPVYRYNPEFDRVADYFRGVAEEVYRRKGLYEGFEQAGTTGMAVGESPLAVDVSFNTKTAYNISSVLYPYPSSGIMAVTGVHTYPLEGRGFGRRLVEATEDIGRILGMNYSATPCNIEPGFWKAMGYHLLTEEFSGREKIVHDFLSRMSNSRVHVATPDLLMFKPLLT